MLHNFIVPKQGGVNGANGACLVQVTSHAAVSGSLENASTVSCRMNVRVTQAHIIA